jgi:hypothetical protein
MRWKINLRQTRLVGITANSLVSMMIATTILRTIFDPKAKDWQLQDGLLQHLKTCMTSWQGRRLIRCLLFHHSKVKDGHHEQEFLYNLVYNARSRGRRGSTETPSTRRR